MGEALTDGEVTDETVPPVQLGDLDAVFGGDQRGADRSEDPVERCRRRPRLGPEPVEHLEGAQLGESGPRSPLAAEGDIGDLWGGENPMLVEETTTRGLNPHTITRPLLRAYRPERGSAPHADWRVHALAVLDRVSSQGHTAKLASAPSQTSGSLGELDSSWLFSRLKLMLSGRLHHVHHIRP